jgi:hypothetical protein
MAVVGVDNDDYDVVVRFLEGHETILFDPASCPLYTKIAWSILQGPAVCIFVTFFITLGLFPGWTSEIRSIYVIQMHHVCRMIYMYHSVFYCSTLVILRDAYYPLHHMLCFFSLSNHINFLLDWSYYQVYVFLFFPVLFLCNGNPSYPPPLGFYVESDIYAIVVQFMFAITGGFLISSSFVHASTLG